MYRLVVLAQGVSEIIFQVEKLIYFQIVFVASISLIYPFKVTATPPSKEIELSGVISGFNKTVEECLELGSKKGAKEVVYGVKGSRIHECWLQDSCSDMWAHDSFSYIVSGGISKSNDNSKIKENPCDGSGYNPYGCK